MSVEPPARPPSFCARASCTELSAPRYGLGLCRVHSLTVIRRDALEDDYFPLDPGELVRRMKAAGWRRGWTATAWAEVTGLPESTLRDVLSERYPVVDPRTSEAIIDQIKLLDEHITATDEGREERVQYIDSWFMGVEEAGSAGAGAA